FAIDAAPVAVHRVPNDKALDTKLALGELDRRREPARKLLVRTEPREAGRALVDLAHGLPTVVQDQEAWLHAAIPEALQAFAQLVVRNLLIESVPGAPSEIVRQRR